MAAVAPGGGSLADLVAIVGDPAKVASVADYNAGALGVAMVQGAANAPTNLALAAQLGASGAYTPRIEATYTAEQAADAHAHVQARHTRGKVVITV